MKLSKSLTFAAFALAALSVAAQAQTSQTYRFGEGQTTVQPGNAHPASPSGSTPKQTQTQSQAQTQPAPTPHNASATEAPKAKHNPKHHRHYAHRASNQDMYSHS